MIIEENQILARAHPNGQGGTQFLYRVGHYGITALTRPEEDTSMIHWKVDVIKFLDENTLEYDVCHTTELADKTLTFRNDKKLNEFLGNAFNYLRELQELEDMLDT